MTGLTTSIADALLGRDGTPEHARQIAAMPAGELVRRYRFSVGAFDHRLFDLSDEQLDQAWLEEVGVGRWPVRTLLGHLADAEVVFTHRLRRAVAEPGSVLSEWDELAFVDAGIYEARSADHNPGVDVPNTVAPPVGAFVGAIYTQRQWVGEWLGNLTDRAWDRRVLHPQRGELSVRDLAVVNTWHLEHHAWFLNAKIEKFLGPRPEPEACETHAGKPGGCGAGCACASGGGTRGDDATPGGNG